MSTARLSPAEAARLLTDAVSEFYDALGDVVIAPEHQVVLERVREARMCLFIATQLLRALEPLDAEARAMRASWARQKFSLVRGGEDAP